MRLDKLIEEKLETSRKTMKRLFAMKQVTVDGVVVQDGQMNVDSQIHEIKVGQQTLTTDEAYYLLNKPAGVVTANHDAVHQTVFDVLNDENRRDDLSAVGRLDRDTEGLLLLTSNGQLAYRLLQPAKKVTKVYEAQINCYVTDEDVIAFAEGITFIGGVTCQPAELVILSRSETLSHVRLHIVEGKFHQVKKMFLARGKKVVYLKRVAMGILALGDLPVGTYRKLQLAELQQLKRYFNE